MKIYLIVLAKIVCILLAVGLVWSVIDYYWSYKSLHPVKNVTITPEKELTVKFGNLTTDFYSVYFLIHHNMEMQPREVGEKRYALMDNLSEALRDNPLVVHISVAEGSSGKEIVSFSNSTEAWHIGDHSAYGEENSAHKFAFYSGSDTQFESQPSENYELKIVVEEKDHPILNYPISVMVKGHRDNGYFWFDRKVTYPIWLTIVIIMALGLWRKSKRLPRT